MLRDWHLSIGPFLSLWLRMKELIFIKSGSAKARCINPSGLSLPESLVMYNRSDAIYSRDNARITGGYSPLWTLAFAVTLVWSAGPFLELPQQRWEGGTSASPCSAQA